jgi:hypothetical protein
MGILITPVTWDHGIVRAFYARMHNLQTGPEDAVQIREPKIQGVS